MAAKSGVVRVKVKKSGTTYNVTSNYPLPDPADIRRHLPPSLRRFLPYSFEMNSISANISNTIANIKPQAWADAIARATHANLNTPDEAVVELTSNQTGFVQLGNRIYKLQTVDTLTTPQRALPVLRRAVMEQAETDAKVIRDEADAYVAKQEEAARNKVFEINQQAAAATDELNRIRRQISALPPEWVIERGIPWRHLSLGPVVGMPITFTVTDFVYFKKTWRSVNPKPVRSYVWVALGTTSPVKLCASVFLDDNFPQLPHINPWGACQQMADAPTAITNIDEYAPFKASIIRSTSTVNLASLASGINQWPQEIRDCLPPAIAALVRNGEINFDRLADLPDDSSGPAATFITPPLTVIDAAQAEAAEGITPPTADTDEEEY